MTGATANRSQGFDPIVDDCTRLLILGSLPGRASLVAGQYYAHPRNAFWLLIGGMIGVNLTSLPYPERLDALRSAHIGLWDVIASAERPGSLDAAIRTPEAADLQNLVANLPDLKAVAFNGAKAARLGRAVLREIDLTLIDLPSSSPAYTKTAAEKAAVWSTLRLVLD